MMFIFKKGSRNAFCNERESEEFMRNYEGIFGVRFPHTDTVDEIMRKMNENCSERLKIKLIKILMKKKVFNKNRISGKYFMIVIDGSHVMTVNEGHCEHCLKRTYEKSGKTIYFHSVVEAELVTENGFSISGICPYCGETEKEFSLSSDMYRRRRSVSGSDFFQDLQRKRMGIPCKFQRRKSASGVGRSNDIERTFGRKQASDHNLQRRKENCPHLYLCQ